MKHRLVIILSLCIVGLTPAWAQGVRSLGMGGVSARGGAAVANPAYDALPGGGVSVPLPLGLLNALGSDRLQPGSDDFDLLTAFDQATHLDTFLFNPAQSPDEVIVSVRREGGVPVVSLDTVGGAGLLVAEGAAIRYGQTLEFPVSFDLGVVSVGVRPYLNVLGRVTPDQGFRDVFAGGSASGAVALDLNGEAGVSLDVVYSSRLPVEISEDFPGRIYLGVRASPFLGLARVDGAGSASVAAVSDAGDVELEYAFDGQGFTSLVSEGGLGYGLRGDVGVVTTLPLQDGELTAGLGVENLGVAFWNGEEFAVEGGSDTATDTSDPVPASRTYFADAFGVNATVAYDFHVAALGLSDLGSLLVAADGAYRAGALSAHLGGEAGFDVEIGELLARAGLGYEGGLVFGVGAGLRLAGVGFDAALHSHRSPFTTHHAVGVSAGLSFGF